MILADRFIRASFLVLKTHYYFVTGKNWIDFPPYPC